MIQLGAEHVLQLVLTVESVAMAIVAGVFLLLQRSTTRGRWWFRGWTLFAFGLAAAAIAQTDYALETPMSFVSALLCAAAGYGAVAGAYEFCKKPVPAWANVASVAGALAACTVAWRSDLAADLAAPETALLVSMAVMAIAIAPSLNHRRFAGVWPMFLAAIVLALLMTRTLVASALLSVRHEELSALYWCVDVIGGGIFATLLAMGEMISLLDEWRLEVEDANEALNRALQSLEVAAKMDALTGLHNRYAFYTLMDGFRNASDACSIVILDLNDLKRINDTYGHFNGDRALLNVAHSLRALARPEDYVFRWGGDEFVLLLFGLTLEAARERVARMKPPAPLDVAETPQPVPLSVSWGIAAFNPLDIDGSLRQADAHLYSQKRLLGSALRGAPVL